MPSASFAHTVPLDTDIESAWDKLQSEETWSGIGPIDSVWDAVHHPNGQLRSFLWSANVGGKIYKGTAKVTKADPPHSLLLTMTTSEINGDLATVLTETGNTCAVTVTLSLTTRGMLSAMFFPAIKQALASGFPQQVESLAAGF